MATYLVDRHVTLSHTVRAIATETGFSRAAGVSWRAIAAECGQPQTWVRRRAGLA